MAGRTDNASWGAIFAGAAITGALLITFSFVALAFGFGIVDPTSDDPFRGVGTAVGLWSLFTIVVALATGAFVTGALAVRAGLLHGVAVWATTAIALTIVTVMAVSGLVGAATSLVGSVATTAARGAVTLAEAAGEATGAAVSGVADLVSDVEVEELGDDVQQVLTDTGIPELQPDYLESQLEEVRSDIGDTATALVTDPGDYEETLGALVDSLQERVDTITASVDREAVTQAVAENTDLTEAEAEEAVDNAIAAAETAAANVGTAIDDAGRALEEAQVEVERIVDEARQTLDDASDAASRAALWIFLGLLAGLIISGFAGLSGSRMVAARNEAGDVRTPVDEETTTIITDPGTPQDR